MAVKLGLRENWKQFTILVVINALVGGMVGLERSILPGIAEQDFDLTAKSAILSFIVVFGISKAITNYYAGILASRFGRKKLLVAGWMAGIPVPLILMFATGWNGIIAANVLLGINQGLTWSSTVVMKIDLVGPKERGLAMGINESAGYLAVGATAFLTGWIASEYGLRPYPFYLGLFFVTAGMLGSLLLVRDTTPHVELENESTTITTLRNVFLDTSWRQPTLGAITQAGLVNNLNDGMIWGLLPLLLKSKGFSLAQIGTIVAIYPMVWGLLQLGTGKLADVWNKKDMLIGGMLLQGMAIISMVWAFSFNAFIVLSILLGLGTALVYPTFLAAITQNTTPQQRAGSIGVFRLWRDLGYALGALLTGAIADRFGMVEAIGWTGTITLLSAIIILVRMKA
ncbi:MAG TPA: MFS transporter [Saprospiraceae bacterium]|nr:MFS transporter [Saprospiraceae bacterium]HRV86397.1 MFS transporter [Saprospiraceae bacterium]